VRRSQETKFDWGAVIARLRPRVVEYQLAAEPPANGLEKYYKFAHTWMRVERDAEARKVAEKIERACRAAV
jgi:hypothetical protein